MNDCPDQAPIFIVGASRSGTELMRAVLNRHPSVWIAPETHYFDDLRPHLRQHAHRGLTGHEQRRCGEYFRALLHRPYGEVGEPALAPWSAEAIDRDAAAFGTGSDAYFEAFCRHGGREKGALRWGEKTPRHVYCLPEILGAFPAARAVCLIRDPRAVIASYRDWKNRGGVDFARDPAHRNALARESKRVRDSYNIVIACLMWCASWRAIAGAREQFTAGRVFIQRYEDLVVNPREALERLTNWLSLPFHPAMFDAPVTNSSYAPSETSGNFSPEFADRWRTKLDEREIAVIQSICTRPMRTLGYDNEPVEKHLGPLVGECLQVPLALAKAVAANHSRIGSLASYVGRRGRFALAGMIGRRSNPPGPRSDGS